MRTSERRSRALVRWLVLGIACCSAPLAAAQQGKYPAFYKAMFALGPPNPETVSRAAEAANIDMESARRFAESQEATAELANNMALARRLGFSGTPSFVIGNSILPGAVPATRLADLVSQERHNFDPTGHYSRSDVFDLTVDRRRHVAATFTDD